MDRSRPGSACRNELIPLVTGLQPDHAGPGWRALVATTGNERLGAGNLARTQGTVIVGTDTDLSHMPIGDRPMANEPSTASGLNFCAFQPAHCNPGAWLKSASAQTTHGADMLVLLVRRARSPRHGESAHRSRRRRIMPARVDCLRAAVHTGCPIKRKPGGRFGIGLKSPLRALRAAFHDSIQKPVAACSRCRAYVSAQSAAVDEHIIPRPTGPGQPRPRLLAASLRDRDCGRDRAIMKKPGKAAASPFDRDPARLSPRSSL